MVPKTAGVHPQHGGICDWTRPLLYHKHLVVVIWKRGIKDLHRNLLTTIGSAHQELISQTPVMLASLVRKSTWQTANPLTAAYLNNGHRPDSLHTPEGQADMRRYLEGTLLPLLPTMRAQVLETIQITIDTPDAILWREAEHIGQAMLQTLQQKPG